MKEVLAAMKQKFILRDQFLKFIIFFFLLSGCRNENSSKRLVTGMPAIVERIATNDSMLTEAKKLIQTGDLILRTGTDYSSEEVKTISPVDKTYSHGGIALKEKDQIYVYHVEPDYYYIHDKVRKELLDSFCNPSKNLGLAVARYNLTKEQQLHFISYLDLQFRKKIAFDIQFNLTTDDSMYCSEMIRKGLAISTAGNVLVPTMRFHDKSKYKIIRQYMRLEEKDFINREIIPIDHLFLNPHCRVVKRYLYLQ